MEKKSIRSKQKTLFLIHCNKCFVLKNDDFRRQFCISKCRHVFCLSCVTPMCAVCACTYEKIPIDRNMPSDLAELFEEPQKLYRRYQKLLKFQVEQCNFLANYYVNTLPLELKRLQRERMSIKRLDAKLKADLEKERQRIAKLNAYIKYHEQDMEKSFRSLDSRPATPTLTSEQTSSFIHTQKTTATKKRRGNTQYL